MNIFKYPDRLLWKQLSQRPTVDGTKVQTVVQSIFDKVIECGDQAVREFILKYDNVELQNFEVSEEEFKSAEEQVKPDFKGAIEVAINNIQAFHSIQKEELNKIETTIGVHCWRKSVAIESVGLYIPGGTAPLFSSLIMLGVPALLAGCKEITVCTPSDSNGQVDPTILYVANRLGLKKVFKVGGAQAVAAMSIGTDSIPKVSKIFGPGNQYVTQAKIKAQDFSTAIDIPAGPSEVLVITDDTSNAAFVASDLLSQAEHGVDSQVMLLSNSERMLIDIKEEVSKQLQFLPRKKIAEKCLEKSSMILLKSLEECIAFSNCYAPEHLILSYKSASSYQDMIINAGSVFMGQWSCESLGDYASGTNHTLPTNGYASSYSGVSIDSFVKKITFQSVTRDGILNLGPYVEILSRAEKLMGHSNAVSIRINEAL